jgi:hypothetical protein
VVCSLSVGVVLTVAVDGDTHPVRGTDGPEDARDHLWLAQDLWMQDDVWRWVDSDPVVKSRVFRECSDPTCKKKEERIGQWQKCSGCKKVRRISTVGGLLRRPALGMVLFP